MVIFYKKTKSINAQKKFNAQTIFVCNHPSAFIDPLVAGNCQLPVLYFVTRGDIFKSWLKPVTWAAHMVPIFRAAEDGADSHKKNVDTFKYLRKVLLRKKSLVLFGEGYTDNVFIRSLKPIKKGPARTGLDTMNECDWSPDIKVQTISLNYSHPKHFRSDVVIAFGDCISLKDYKEDFEKSRGHAITKLTKAIEKSMQNELIYVKEKELAPFVENILILSRKGMNHYHHTEKTPLLDRYNYSKTIATTINEQYDNTKGSKWEKLKTATETYFNTLKTKRINDNWVHKYDKTKSQSIASTILLFILTFPLTLLGLIHQFIPYFIVKQFVEGKFKREVFWSGVKIMMGAALSTIYNISFIFLFYAYIHPNYWLAIAYFFTIPAISGIFAYNQINHLKSAFAYKKANTKTLEKLIIDRALLVEKLDKENLI